MNRSDHDPHDEIRDLLVEAGPPATIPAEDLATIRAAAREAQAARSGSPIFEGQSLTPIVEGRSAHRTILALAATLVLVITAVWLFRAGRSPIGGAAVATVELLRGDATVIGLTVGDEISAGDAIDTGGRTPGSPTMVALRMPSGHSVRLHADSELRFESATRLALERGAIYVDSGVDGASDGLEIVTPLGTVREVGTQYEVRLSDNGRGRMRVRVREGQVSLSRDGESYAASRGEELTVGPSGAVARGSTPLAGDDWSWVVAAAPPFDTDGQTLEAYLAWVGRETGLAIGYDDPSLEIDAAEITVIGSVDRLTPEETLGVILPGSGLGYRVDGDTLVVTGPSGL